MTSTVETNQNSLISAISQEDASDVQSLHRLIQQHDELLAKSLDGVQNHPLTHVNPYVLLDLLRRQSQWLHLLEARVRSLEESL